MNPSHSTKARGGDRLAPSVRRAHRRVQWAWYASIVHGVILLALGAYFLTLTPRGWIFGGLCIVGAGGVPLLGRAAYLGNSFRAFLLFLTAIVPPPAVYLLWGDPTLTFGGLTLGGLALGGLIFVPFYYLGVKGAIGLRGRRGSRRGRTPARRDR